MTKPLLIHPIYSPIKTNFNLLLFIIILSFRVRISYNNEYIRNLFLELKSKFGLHHVVLKTPKTSPDKLTLFVVELHELPDIEKTKSQEELSCLNWTERNGRRKVCED